MADKHDQADGHASDSSESGVVICTPSRSGSPSGSFRGSLVLGPDSVHSEHDPNVAGDAAQTEATQPATGPVACLPCRKIFPTTHSLDTHMATASMHVGTSGLLPPDLSCGLCEEVYPDTDTRNRHFASRKHRATVLGTNQDDQYCDVCDRFLAADNNLRAHRRSHVHKALVGSRDTAAACTLCPRFFASKSALADHMGASHPRASALACDVCTLTFETRNDLHMHTKSNFHKAMLAMTSLSIRESSNEASTLAPKPDDSLYCNVCRRSFNTPNCIDIHRMSNKHREMANGEASDSANGGVSGVSGGVSGGASGGVSGESDADGLATPTPLDVFFGGYSGFPYDRSASPETSFRELCRHYGWTGVDGRRYTGVHRDKYREALVGEMRVWFGVTTDLGAWHDLLRALGDGDDDDALPATVTQCKKRLGAVHVNIIDLIAWRRAGSPAAQRVRVFASVKALRKYIKKTERYFPPGQVVSQYGDNNVVLKQLLRRIGSGGP